MHNVDVEALEQTADKGRQDPSAVLQPVDLKGEWNASTD